MTNQIQEQPQQQSMNDIPMDEEIVTQLLGAASANSVKQASLIKKLDMENVELKKKVAELEEKLKALPKK
ncbi:MAG: hypothetical protein GY861_19115 [bacterium]|nr:hypothetical protein [bacterium]